MLVAIPNFEGRISPVLDVAARLLLIRVESGKEVAREQVAIAENRPDQLIRTCEELRVDVLICGAISQPLACWLADAGVRVVSHLCGEIETIFCAFLTDTLNRAEFRMPGCAQGRCGWQHKHRGCRTNPGVKIATSKTLR
jgi:predicted Fe-Mo cluster-binding NifX family protein